MDRRLEIWENIIFLFVCFTKCPIFNKASVLIKQILSWTKSACLTQVLAKYMSHRVFVADLLNIVNFLSR